jgi:hypothetical protein
VRIEIKKELLKECMRKGEGEREERAIERTKEKGDKE